MCMTGFGGETCFEFPLLEFKGVGTLYFNALTPGIGNHLDLNRFEEGLHNIGCNAVPFFQPDGT